MVARKPSKTELKQYLERIKSLRSPKKEANESFSVRFFEQNNEKRIELPNEDAFGESMNQLDASELKDALMEIKQEMGGKEEQDAFDEVISQMGGDWDKMKTADDLEKMVARMDAYNAAIDAEIDETGADLPPELLEELDLAIPGLPSMGSLGKRVKLPQIPEEPWTGNQRKKITKFNLVLRRTARNMRRGAQLDKKNVLGVYKAYHASRFSLAHSWDQVPLEVWDLLWKVFSTDESINIHRLSHISLLARDMSEAKVTLNPAQQLLTIEAVFVDGWEEKAVENWRRCVSSLGDENAETFQEFWELGVRMFCRVGDFDQAQRAVDKLIQKHSDPRILMPIIRTFSEMGTEDSQDRAWNSYRKMRRLLGADMKLSDYDQVISYFLTTNQTESALFAFVDMMSNGKIDLKKQQFMPSVVANKFFFGKWLKRLIGAGDLNGAESVINLMRNKGIDAAAVQLNGLIGAWQRSGGADNLDKADQMAWGMIESRIKFVQERQKQNSNKDAKNKYNANQASPRGVPALSPLPRATLETFCLLAENYRLRDLPGQLESLWQAFRDAEISPDAFMINQLLESLIQSGQTKEAIASYHNFVTEQGVTPDPYTFSALWKTLGVNRLHRISPDVLAAEEPQQTRALFAEMVKFRKVFEPEGIDGQLARKILHTFRRIGDRTGLVVALTALRDIFKFLPPEMLVLEMTLGTMKLSWDTPQNRYKLVLAKRAMDRDLLDRVGGDAAQLEGMGRGEALYEYMQKHFWPKDGSDEDKRAMFLEAAEHMGVYRLLGSRKKE